MNKGAFTGLVKPTTKTIRCVPKKKQTSLGLYVTAREAFEKRKAEPGQVKVLDVREPFELAVEEVPGLTRNTIGGHKQCPAS